MGCPDRTAHLGWLIAGVETTVAISLAAWTLALVVGTFGGRINRDEILDVLAGIFGRGVTAFAGTFG